MSKHCPSCNRPASGRFCSHCGAAVAAAAVCGECAAALRPGARFCNACGAAAATATAGSEGNRAEPAAAGVGARAPWLVAGVAVVALLAVVLVPRFRDQAPEAVAFTSMQGAAPIAAPAGPQSIDLASMTPREAADRLFDRVMRTAAAGDSAAARGFVPMALSAYEQVQDLDADARYHIGVLHLLNGEPEPARAAADQILAADAKHLFGLFTAAQAAAQMGNRSEAQGFYRRFLDAYPTEVTRDLPEYSAHSPAFPEMRAEAMEAVQGSR